MPVCRLLLVPSLLLTHAGLFAGTITSTYNANFQFRDVNMWNGGAAATYSAEKFIGASWNVSGGFGGIERTVVGDFGLEASGRTSGSAGIGAAIHATAGRIDAGVPARIELKMADSIRPGSLTTVNAKVVYGDTMGFSTNSPDFGFRINAQLQMQASVTAEACVFGCLGFRDREILNINANPEVLAVNMGPGPAADAAFDQKIRAGGVDITSTVMGYLGTEIPLVTNKASGMPLATIQYGSPGQATLLPVVQTGGFADPVTGITTASGRADVLTVKVDIGQTISELTGYIVPPLAANLGSLARSKGWGIPNDILDVMDDINVNLITARAGASLGFQQDFIMGKPQVLVDLKLDQTGQVFTIPAGTGNGLNSTIQLPTSLFASPDASVSFTPTVRLGDVSFTNRTSAYLDPVFDVSALGVGFGAVAFGPLYAQSFRVETPRIPVYSNTFNLTGSMPEQMGALNISLDKSIVTESGWDAMYFYTANKTYYNTLYRDIGSYHVTANTILNGTSIVLADGDEIPHFPPEEYFGDYPVNPPPSYVTFGGPYVRAPDYTFLGLGPGSSISADGNHHILEIQSKYTLVGYGGKIDNVGIINSGLILVGSELSLSNTSISHRGPTPGEITVDSSATLNLENAGSISSVLNIQSFGVTTVSNSVAAPTVFDGGIVNRGTLLNFHGNMELRNVDNAGGIVISYDHTSLAGSVTGGDVLFAQGSVLELATGANMQNVHVDGAGVILASGDALVSNSTINVQMWSPLDPAFVVTGPLVLDNSTLTLNGNRAVIDGGSLTLSNSSVNLAEAALGTQVPGIIVNRGTVTTLGTVTIDAGLQGLFYPDEYNTFLNESGGQFGVWSGTTFIGGTTTNYGSVYVAPGATLLGQVFYQPDGSIVNDGIFSYSRFYLNGGTYSGSGVFNAAVFNTQGTWTQSTGLTSFGIAAGADINGDYHQASAAVLEVNMNDFLAPFTISGLADLAGGIRVNTALRFSDITDGFFFQALYFGASKGTFDWFAVLGGEDLSSAFTWDPFYDEHGLFFFARAKSKGGNKPNMSFVNPGMPPAPLSGPALVVLPSGPPPEVPEPGTVFLLATGFAAITLANRRRS